MRFEQEVNIFNPSALNRKFSAIQTDFDVTLGKISAIISDSDIEQYQDGHTTMNSKLSATIQDLDGFHTQVSEMQTEYDEEFVNVNSRLTTFDETLDSITASVSSVSQSAIKSDQIHYLATSASSGVTTETAGWTTTPQRITSTNRYLWTYHTYTKGDNTTVNTTPVITGVWGDQGLRGDTGVSIAGVTNYYLASPLSSGVTIDTSGWTTGIQTMTATNQYLWNYEVVYGSDDVIISTSDPVIIGRYGQNGANGTNGNDGRGISSITEHYAVSSSNTTAPSRWSDTMVNTTTENRYLWNYETILYTDGDTEDSTKRVIGTHGEKGDSATTYEIMTSVDAIIRSQAGTPSPAFVTFTCYKRVGAGSATTQSCYWSIEEYVNDSWTTIEAGGSATSSKTRYVSNTATSVRATAYLESTLSSASLIDQQDVPIISNGADGYTVVLSNESHTFAGNVSSAVSGSTFSNVIAYKGSTRVAATIGTITGQPTGMTTSISYNGTTSARFNVEVSTSMTTKSGTLSVPVTVDGNTFALTFSYAVAFKGETGSSGVNTATVYLYRLLKTTITPNAPVNQTTYTFSTKTLSGNPGGSWVTTPPLGIGTLWMAVATASSNTDTDTIEASEWTVAKLARDGSSGANGVDGYNKATITLYRRYASTPSKPTIQTVYTFSTGTLDTIPSGWSTSIPAVDANHNPCYATSVSAVSRDDTYTITSSAWTAPVKIVEDGEDGIGITATTPVRYVSSSTTAPSKPTANVKITEDRPITGVWTKALPALTNTYKYIYTCDMIEWDDGNTITFTDVVMNNALSDLVTRVSEAELKIEDDAIVATVRNSESYKADLSSKNATYSGAGIPTSNNLPASEWTTEALKQMHVNDTFMSNSGQIYQYVQGSYGLYITFSDESYTEPQYDYVRIFYRRNNKTYALPNLSGNAISGARVFVPTNVFWLYWKTDGSRHYYGFKITSVEWVFNSWGTATEMSLPSITATDTSGDNYPETAHPYTYNEEKLWKYTTSNAETPTLTYGWVDREDPAIKSLDDRMSSAELKITDNAIVSTVTSSEFGQLMTSAITQTADGIYLDAKYVSWDADYSSMTKEGVLTCRGANIEGSLNIVYNNTNCTVGQIAHCTVYNYTQSTSYNTTVQKINTDCFYFGTKNSKNYLTSTHAFDTSYSKYPQECVTVAGNSSIRLTTLAYNYENLNNLPDDTTLSTNDVTTIMEVLESQGSNGDPRYQIQGRGKESSFKYYLGTYGATYYYYTPTNLSALFNVGVGSIYVTNTIMEGTSPGNYYSQYYALCIDGSGTVQVQSNSIDIHSGDGVYRMNFNSSSGINLYANGAKLNIKASSFVIGSTDYNKMGLWGTSNGLFFKYQNNNAQYRLQMQSTSSRRYKENIMPLTNADLSPNRLYELQAKQFRYIEGVPLQYADMKGQTIPGFIAEEVAEIYPSAVIHSEDGRAESWDERRIIPAMLALIQEQNERIKTLEAMMN